MKKLVFAIMFFWFNFNIFPQNFQLPILDIKAYFNDMEIEGTVYKNIINPSDRAVYRDIFNSPVQSIDCLSSFVKLNSIFNLLEAEVKINNRTIEISGEKTGNIQINYISQNNIEINSSLHGGSISRQGFTNNSIVIINNEYYIAISMVRYLINGALRDNENSVTLYTRDYERLDIPLALNDCFLALNNLLNDQTKNDIKISSEDELKNEYLSLGLRIQSLGLWIQNNWVGQSNNRITKLFVDKGVRYTDYMSRAIILGYHYYLNGIEKTVEELISDQNNSDTININGTNYLAYKPIDDSQKIIIDFDFDEMNIINVIFEHNNITKEKILVNQSLYYSYMLGRDGTPAKSIMSNENIDILIKVSFIEQNTIPALINKNTIFPVDHLWSNEYIEKNENIFYSNISASISFSRAGFNNNRTEAIIYCGIIYAPEWGHGGIYHLRMEGDNWKIINYYGNWES
jgi:hypothetical protein